VVVWSSVNASLLAGLVAVGASVRMIARVRASFVATGRTKNHADKLFFGLNGGQVVPRHASGPYCSTFLQAFTATTGIAPISPPNAAAIGAVNVFVEDTAARDALQLVLFPFVLAEFQAAHVLNVNDVAVLVHFPTANPVADDRTYDEG